MSDTIISNGVLEPISKFKKTEFWDRFKYYPINLDLRNKRCIVIGGGQIAERKTFSLLECGAEVLLISPGVTQRLDRLRQENKNFYYRNGYYHRDDLKGAALVISATNDHEVNCKIANDAKELNIIVNVVDVPDLCDFIVPSVIRRGDLLLTVSTSGASPALSKKIREELEGIYGKEYESLLKIFFKIRKEVIKKIPDINKRKTIFEELIEADLISLLKKKQLEKVYCKIKDITGLEIENLTYTTPT
ncbi:MAG: bifunctional precorrin-2 dehydrogenase/sirohydrochlorin ferrochelatase [bacterium]